MGSTLLPRTQLFFYFRRISVLDEFLVLQYELKGHSHATLVHFKNEKYVLTSMNAPHK